MTSKTTYVELWYRGAFFDESGVREVGSRDLSALEVPPGVYAVQFYDVLSTEADGVAMKSGRQNESPRFFLGGTIMTQADVERDLPDHDTLIWNMRVNHYERVIKTRAGHLLPFNDSDVLVQL